MAANPLDLYQKHAGSPESGTGTYSAKQPTQTTRPVLPKGYSYGEAYIPQASPTLQARDYKREDVEAFKEYGVDTRFSQTDPFEQLAQKQSAGEKVWNGAVRLVGTTVTKFATGLGYLGGFVDYGLHGFDDISRMTDNGFSAYFSELEEGIKTGVPIFVPPSVKQGGLWDKGTSLSWWMDSGIDGAAFMISSLIPGGALKALGVGAKIASSLNLGTKAANAIDLTTMTVMNTVSEAAFEAKGVQDRVRQDLNAKVQQGLISPEEMERRAAEAAVSTFRWNAVVLAVPNLIQNKLFFGGPNEGSILKKIFNPETGKLVEGTGALTRREIAKDLAKQTGLGVLREGFWEENVQLAIENYETAVAKGENDKGAISGIMGEMWNNLFTPEGQEAIFLGGAMGVIGGGVGSIRQSRQENKIRQRAVERMSNHIGSYTQNLRDNLKNMYETDPETGEIILDENNQPIVDQTKVTEVLVNLTKKSQQEQAKNIALLKGDKDLYNYIKNEEFTDFASPFLMEEGGLDILEKQIDRLADQEFKEQASVEGWEFTDQSKLNEVKSKFKAKAKDLYQVAQRTKDKSGVWNFTQDSSERKLFDSWLERYNYEVVKAASKVDYLRDEVKRVYADYTLELSRNGSMKFENYDLSSQMDKDRVNSLLGKVQEYQGAFEEAEKRYKEISTKDGARKLWETERDFFKALEDDKAEIENEVANEVQKQGQKQATDNAEINKINREIEELTTFLDENPDIDPTIIEQKSNRLSELEAKKEALLNPVTKKVVEDSETHANEHNIKTGQKAVYKGKVVDVTDIDLAKGTAIIRSGNQFEEVRISSLQEYVETEPVANIDEAVSETMTTNPVLDINSKENTKMDEVLKNTPTGTADYREADHLGKKVFVVMHKMLQSFKDKVSNKFKWSRDKEGLPIDSNTTGVNFNYVNSPLTLKENEVVEFKLVELSKEQKDAQQEAINKSIARINSTPKGYYAEAYPNYGFGDSEAIGIYSNGKLVGFVQLPHAIDNLESHDKEYVLSWLHERQKLIEQRQAIIKKLKAGEKVESTVKTKGSGNYFAQIKDGKGVFTDNAGNPKSIFNSIEIRDEDKVDGRAVFVINNGKSLIVPSIPETNTLKGRTYKNTVKTIESDIAELGNYGLPGQVFMLVKSANGKWRPIPVFANKMTEPVITNILSVLENNQNEGDLKKIISELNPYTYASLGTKANVRIGEQTNLKGEQEPTITVNGKSFSIQEVVNNPVRQSEFIEEMKTQSQNISKDDINTQSRQADLKSNETLTTNAIKIDGQYYIQPYIEYNPIKFTEEDLTIATDVKTTSSTSDIEAKKADIERRRREELDELIKPFNADIATWQEIKDYTGVNNPGEALEAIYDIADKEGRVERHNGQVSRKFTEKELRLIDFLTKGRGSAGVGLPDSIDSWIEELQERKDKASKTRSDKNKAGKINAKYDAELAALEAKPVILTKPSEDLEAKKADIEKRRQEELKYWQKEDRQNKIKEGRKTTKKVLDSIKAKYPSNTVQGIIIRLLEKIIDLNTFAIINSEGLKLAGGQDATEFRALVTGEGMAMTQGSINALMAGEVAAVKTFIHELVHTFTKEKVSEYRMEKSGLINKAKLTEKEKQAVAELERIYQKVKSQFPSSTEYGLTNLDEFLAEAFSNSSFQGTLNEIQSEGKKTTLFKEWLNAVKDLFYAGLEKWAKKFNKKIPSKSEIGGILEDIIAWTEDLIDDKLIKLEVTTDEINAKYDAELAALVEKSEEKVAETKVNQKTPKELYDLLETSQVINELKEAVKNLEERQSNGLTITPKGKKLIEIAKQRIEEESKAANPFAEFDTGEIKDTEDTSNDEDALKNAFGITDEDLKGPTDVYKTKKSKQVSDKEVEDRIKKCK